MKRKYSNSSKWLDDVVYYTGYESLNTVAKDMPTLFNNSVRPLEEILKYADIAKSLLGKKVQHINFTSDCQFDNTNLINQLLDIGYYVTIQCPMEYMEKFQYSEDKLIIVYTLPKNNISSLNLDNSYFLLNDESSLCLTNLRNFTKNITSKKLTEKDIIIARERDLNVIQKEVKS